MKAAVVCPNTRGGSGARNECIGLMDRAHLRLVTEVSSPRPEVQDAGPAGSPWAAQDDGTLLAAAMGAAAHYRGLFEDVDDALLVVDAEGWLREANAAAGRLLGYAPEELPTLRLADVVAPGGGAGTSAWLDLWRDGRWRGELDVRQKQGALVPVEAQATVLTQAVDRTAIWALRDSSERRARERAQLEFVAMISHELRNPLTPLKGYLQRMQRAGTYDAHATDVMLNQVQRLTRLIGDLLDVSRVQAGRLELQRGWADLGALARAAAEQAQALTHQHTIRVEAPERPVVSWCDRQRIEQVLHNLLSNAIKYSPDGGEIVVRLEALAGEARMSVTDQGIGIPPEDLARLFGRFTRAAAALSGGMEGLGLGLHISQVLVQAQGGRMWADSVLGRGSTFSFALPHESAGKERQHGASPACRRPTPGAAPA